MLQSRQRIERCRDHQHHGRCDQATAGHNYAQPLNHRHDSVDGGPHVIRGEAPDEGIEFGRGRAYSQEQRDFNKDEDEAGDAKGLISGAALDLRDQIQRNRLHEYYAEDD